jgi:hypothetical protein
MPLSGKQSLTSAWRPFRQANAGVGQGRGREQLAYHAINPPEAARDYLKSEGAAYRPTPLLLWFVSHANAKDGPREQVSIDSADFGFVYESVLADVASAGRAGSGVSKAKYPKLTLSSQDPGRPLVGEIRFPAPIGTDEQTSGRKVRLDLRETGSALWFWRHLLAADIAVAGAVRFGTRAADFVLGPDVDLECDAFACDAATVRVTAPSENEGVVLLAKRYLGDAVRNSRVGATVRCTSASDGGHCAIPGTSFRYLNPGTRALRER